MNGQLHKFFNEIFIIKKVISFGSREENFQHFLGSTLNV